MNSRLIIATTSLSRMDIHKKTFPKYIELINYIGITDVHWLINIDKPKFLKNLYTQDEAEAYMKSVIPSYIKTYFSRTQLAGFRSAFIKLNRVLPKLITDNSVILWLEDDWVTDLNKKQLIKNIVENLRPMCQVNFTRNGIGSFNPSVWGGKLYKTIFTYENVHNKYKDPEKNMLNFIWEKIIKNKTILNMVVCNYANTKDTGQHLYDFHFSNLFAISQEDDVTKVERLKKMDILFNYIDQGVQTNDDVITIVKNMTNENMINNVIIPLNVFHDAGREWLDNYNSQDKLDYLSTFKEKKKLVSLVNEVEGMQ